MNLRISLLILLAVLIAACSPPGAVPEFVYYRLPAPEPVAALPEPRFSRALVVDNVLAEGVYGEQPILYSEHRDGLRLQQYHYQLWAEPPTRMIQRRLIRQLQESGLAEAVVDRASGRERGLRITGLVRGFERVRLGSDWQVRVALQWRVEGGRGRGVLWLADYEEFETAAGDSIEASVRALATALDRALARFRSDLGALSAD